MSTQGIYRGNVNFVRPADSYVIAANPDGSAGTSVQLATYYFPEPTYGYDQFGNPQYGTDQIDIATGNVIPQYTQPYAARYDAAGNRIQGAAVSPSLFQGDATYDPRVGTPMFSDMSPTKIDMTSGQAIMPETAPMQSTPAFGIGTGPTGRVEDFRRNTGVGVNPAMGGRQENFRRSSSVGRNPNLDAGFTGGQTRPTTRRGDARPQSGGISNATFRARRAGSSRGEG